MRLLKRIITYWKFSDLPLRYRVLSLVLKSSLVIFKLQKRQISRFLPNLNLFPWQGRSLEDARKDYNSVDVLRRLKLIEKYIDFASIDSFLELGCNSGGNLIPLAKKYPNIAFTGVDFNNTALNFAQITSDSLGLTNIQFKLFDLRSQTFRGFLLSGLNRFDVIFSWATLIYIHPHYIKSLTSALVNNFNLKMVLLEQDVETKNKLGNLVKSEPTWKRSYAQLIRNSPDNLEYSITVELDALSLEDWHPGGGFGKVIICSKTFK